MKVRHNGSTKLQVNHGNIAIVISPGVNNLPDYDWVHNLISKNKDLEIVIDVKYTDIGTIADESKVINKDKAIAKRVTEVVEETPTEEVEEDEAPKKRRRRRTPPKGE